MHSAVQIVSEGRRGCGYRTPGRMYFRCDGEGRACGRLPIQLTTCPCCGQSMVAKQMIGFTWIPDFDRLVQNEHCVHAGTEHCNACPLSKPIGKVGLIWVGAKYYPTPLDFTREAKEMGISRYIHNVPKDFEVGKHWVALAHPFAVKNPEPKPTPPKKVEGREITDEEWAAFFTAEKEYKDMVPGIFHMFKPDRIEYVCSEQEANDDEFIESLLKRGITPVMIRRIGEQGKLFDEADEADEDNGGPQKPAKKVNKPRPTRPETKKGKTPKKASKKGGKRK